MCSRRPLGNLQFLRIWHDNSGKGPNASWYLAYVVIRDVQTGDRFEFIFNDWLGLEKTGMVREGLCDVDTFCKVLLSAGFCGVDMYFYEVTYKVLNMIDQMSRCFCTCFVIFTFLKEK